MKFFNSSKDDLFDAYKSVYIKEAVNPKPALQSVQPKKKAPAVIAPAPVPFSGGKVGKPAQQPQAADEIPSDPTPDIEAEDIINKAAPMVNAINQGEDLDLEDILNQTGGVDDVNLPTYKDTDLPEWDYEDVEPLVQRSYDLKEPILIYGSAGIGKSTIIEDFGRDIAAASTGRIYKNWDDTSYQEKEEMMYHPEKYFGMVKILPNKYTPEDILGVPKVMNQKEWLVTDKFMWIEYLSRPGAAGILFLDELNTASARMLYSLYEVVLDKAAAGTKFAPDVAIMAAGNLENELNPNLEPLPQPLVDRFTSGVLVADVDKWVELAKKWKVDRRILTFVLSNPKDNFYAEPITGGGGSPTPRSLVKFSNMLKHIYKDYSDKIKSGALIKKPILRQIGKAAAGKLGTKWAKNFVEFLAYSRSFNFADLIKDAANLNKRKKAEISALQLYLLGRAEWATKQLIGVPQEAINDPNVKEVMEGILTVSNALDNNWNINLWVMFKKDMAPELFKSLMVYTVQGDYNPTVKAAMVVKMKKIGKILKGETE